MGGFLRNVEGSTDLQFLIKKMSVLISRHQKAISLYYSLKYIFTLLYFTLLSQIGRLLKKLT